jgi:hypothetical protein
MLRSQAERAIGLVIEGACPICDTELRLHDDRACCPCGGCSYRVSTDRLEMLSPCELHPARECEHWKEVREAAQGSFIHRGSLRNLSTSLVGTIKVNPVFNARSFPAAIIRSTSALLMSNRAATSPIVRTPTDSS